MITDGRECVYCTKKIDRWARKDSVFCCPKCRIYAYRTYKQKNPAYNPLNKFKCVTEGIFDGNITP